jgi:hypothetical protein
MTLSPDRVALPHPLVARTRPRLTVVANYPATAESYIQGTLPLAYSLPSGLDADPRSRAITLVRPPTDPSDIPGPHAWASRFMQAVIEVVASDRPLSQLARWTAPTVYEQISKVQQHVSARQRDAGQRYPRQHIATVHVSQISPQAAEVAARVVGGRRSRALAARLDFQRERWTCTALDFG